MKIFLRLLLLLVGVGVIAYGLKTIPLGNLSSEINKVGVYVEKDSDTFLQDWTAEELLEKINSARVDAKVRTIKINEKLNQAAKSRLSVVLTEKDYEGSITGLTRELAVKNAGYPAVLIGDLLLLDFFKTNDPITDWESDSITKATLLHKDFREVGIAIKNEDDRVNVYVILVSPGRITTTTSTRTNVTWGGPDLWEAVNKRRVEMGVNQLRQKDELCTIASIRLNQLLELGKLDGHAGFVPVLDRPDLKWISEKYNISEFLAQGYSTPQETVKAWENTLGHRALLAGGEYVWGCVYSQNTFAVAIAAY